VFELRQTQGHMPAAPEEAEKQGGVRYSPSIVPRHREEKKMRDAVMDLACIILYIALVLWISWRQVRTMVRQAAVPVDSANRRTRERRRFRNGSGRNFFRPHGILPFIGEPGL
jgi:hypothetical protein